MKHAASWVVGSTLAIAIAIACAPGLPSATPLGEGKLAEPEPEPGERHVPREDAGSDAEEQGDTGLDAGTSDDAARPETGGADADDTVADASPDADGETDGGPDTSTVANFTGEYRGEDVSIIRIDGLPDRRERDPNARTKVEQSTDDRVEITLINSANGDPLCTIEARVSGNDAEVTPGQECFSEGSAVQGSVSSGKARLEKEQLILDLDVALELSFGPETRSGNLDYHFEGSRK